MPCASLPPTHVLVPAGATGSPFVFQRVRQPARRSARAKTPSAASSEAVPQPSSGAAEGSGGESPRAREYQYNYRGSDGRLKATFEQAFLGPASAETAAAIVRAPWELGYQLSEGNLAWNAELKTRMIKRVAAEELGLSDEAVEVRLARVQALLPDLAEKLPAMRPPLVAALVAAAEELGGRVLQLKEIFPGANVSRLAVREPQLVLGFDMARLAAIAAELAEMFPRIDIDRLVEANPSVLDLKGLRLAMEEAQRIMPSMDIQSQMASDPKIIFSFQRGSRLIPYDIDTPTTAREDDGDEYAAREWY